MAVVKTRPYRRILTSTLHRRFVHASASSLLICYAVSFLIGSKTSFFWSWFPLGLCGLRTLLLFVSSLSIFILRVGQLHVGSRTATSPFQSWRQITFSLGLVQTYGWYIFSAWWFREVYIWSVPTEAKLNWVNPGRSFERAQLNERPLYLHCFYFLLAIIQGTIHLYTDQDRLTIPVARPSENPEDQRTHPLDPVIPSITRSTSSLLLRAMVQVAVASITGPVVYVLFLRQKAWQFTLYFARMFWNFSKSAEQPPGLIPPLHISLLFRAAFSGFLLLLLWQATNILFSVFLARAPLKKGLPLTNEVKDPNGSLINGLKAKSDLVSTFALWELCLISQQFPDRRKGIFNDIDREGGSAWSQVFEAVSGVVKGLNTRITEFQKPPPAAPIGNSEIQAVTTAQQLQALPRLTAAPKEEKIFAPMSTGNTGAEKFESAFGSVAKQYGQNPDWTPSARAKARQLFDRASAIMLSPEQKRRISASANELKMLTSPTINTTEGGNSFTVANPLIRQFLLSPLGMPFRQPYARRLRSIVLGSPYDRVSPLVDAIESLTKFLVASLAEDQFGKVQSDVPKVVRLFTDTVLLLESFASENGLKIHWTDVYPQVGSKSEESKQHPQRVEEIELVLASLKNGLSELLQAFRLYLREVGIVGKDLRLARQAAGISD